MIRSMDDVKGGREKGKAVLGAKALFFVVQPCFQAQLDRTHWDVQATVSALWHPF
jgi:hypothetical protein